MTSLHREREARSLTGKSFYSFASMSGCWVSFPWPMELFWPWSPVKGEQTKRFYLHTVKVVPPQEICLVRSVISSWFIFKPNGLRCGEIKSFSVWGMHSRGGSCGMDTQLLIHKERTEEETGNTGHVFFHRSPNDSGCIQEKYRLMMVGYPSGNRGKICRLVCFSSHWIHRVCERERDKKSVPVFSSILIFLSPGNLGRCHLWVPMWFSPISQGVQQGRIHLHSPMHWPILPTVSNFWVPLISSMPCIRAWSPSLKWGGSGGH